jgi:hypothetical protein
MWSLLPTRSQVFVVAILGVLFASGLNAANAWWLGTPQGPFGVPRWSMAAATVVGACGILLASVWRWVWRAFPILDRAVFPDLNGVWKGEIDTTWDAGKKGGGTKRKVTMTINQGLFATSVMLQSGESISYSTRCLLERHPEAGRFRLWYSYDNAPRTRLQDRSRPHEGVAWLEFKAGADPPRLTGGYYTHRQTAGDIDVKRDWRG